MLEGHEKLLFEILQKAWNSRNPKWRDCPFEIAKLLSTTEKGNAVEDFAAQLLEQTGHADVERHHSRRGDWDVRAGKTTIEVKCATSDTSGNFQFNGIRYDTKYGLLLVVGIAPEAVLFNIYRRKELLDLTLAPMAKGTNAAYKLTRTEAQLRPIADFGKVFGDLIA